MATPALIILLNVWGYTNTTPTDRRALQGACDISAGTQDVNEACCASGHRRMQGGDCNGETIPQTCTPSCAVVFIPFLDNCAPSLGKLGIDLNNLYALYDTCRQVANPAEPQKIYALGGEYYDGSWHYLNTSEVWT